MVATMMYRYIALVTHAVVSPCLNNMKIEKIKHASHVNMKHLKPKKIVGEENYTIYF